LIVVLCLSQIFDELELTVPEFVLALLLNRSDLLHFLTVLLLLSFHPLLLALLLVVEKLLHLLILGQSDLLALLPDLEEPVQLFLLSLNILPEFGLQVCSRGREERIR